MDEIEIASNQSESLLNVILFLPKWETSVKAPKNHLDQGIKLKFENRTSIITRSKCILVLPVHMKAFSRRSQ